MSFTFFDHTGDIGVRVDARTLDELFRDAATAFTEAITDPWRVEARQSVSLTLEAPAVDLLLVDWLNEILYRFEVDHLLVSAVEVHVEGRNPGRSPCGAAAAIGLNAQLAGEPLDPGRHGVKVLIKAVTYHALDVHEDSDGWHATVVFDI